jgi:16S rRNA (uracil1498-N3)-methyltransferase
MQAVGKGDKLDAVVRDATELGATRVVPVITERSVSRPPASRSERWRRIAVEAARQCGRGDAPIVDEPAPLADVLEHWPALEAHAGDARLCLSPSASAPIGPRLRGLDARGAIALLIGPEGGLTQAEISAAARAGFADVHLGRIVLRTETVCAAVLGAILALSDEA